MKKTKRPNYQIVRKNAQTLLTEKDTVEEATAKMVAFLFPIILVNTQILVSRTHNKRKNRNI